MGITTYDWATQLQQEALKCWFYGISWSILLSVYQLLTVFFSEPAAVQPVNAKSNEKETSEKQPAARQKPSVTARDPALRSKIYTQLMIDGCDIFLPGAAVGWIPVDQVFVGTCQTISSALAGRQVWDRVQAVA